MTDPSESDTLPADTRLGRTALRVNDLDELVEFYQSVVGFEVVWQDGPEAALGVGETPLLRLEADATAPAREPQGTGLFHNAFRVPSRGALGDALARITDRWQLDGASDHLVSEALYLTDPEGNGIEIYRDFQREEWPTTERGNLQMDTLPLDLSALAADAAGGDRLPAGTDLGHVHLEVSSIPDARAFYVDALGFEEMVTIPRALFVAAGGYHHHVGANTWHRRTLPVDGRGLAWFEVVLPDAESLDALRARLHARDLTVSDRDSGFEVVDPDGIRIRVRADGV